MSTAIEDKEPLKCEHCGHIGCDGDEVIEEYVRAGGQQNMKAFRCYNQEKCWERWDKKYLRWKE